MNEHRVTGIESVGNLTVSERLTCSCGWEGHRSRWADRDHGPDVPPLPSPPPPAPVSRDVLRAAIYGERRRFR